MISSLFRILRDPKGAEGNGSANHAQGATPELMDEVFERLQLPKTLRGDVKANANAKPATEKTADKKEQTKDEKFFDESDAGPATGEEAEEAVEAAAAADKREQATPAAAAAAPSAEQTEAKGEVDAWTVKVANLEGQLADASAEEQTALTKELAEAREQLTGWEAVAAGKGEDEPAPAAVETVDTVKAELAKERLAKEQLTTKVQELEQQVQQAKDGGLSVANVHPLFFTEKPEAIDQLDQQYAQFEKWALQNFDGIEEKVDDTGKVLQAGFTKEQVRGRLAEISELRKNLIPAAKQALAEQTQARAAAKTVYPELFDKSRPEGKAAEAILHQVPVLKALFPNVWVIIGDAMAGERLRLSKLRAGGANGKTLKKIAGTGKPSAARGGGAASAGTNGQRNLKRASEVSAVNFVKRGGDRNALIGMLEGAAIPTVNR